MVFEISCESFPRFNHYRKRLRSIGPRFNYICKETLESENLRQTNEDEQTIGQINRKLKDYSEPEHVNVELIGERSARDVISTGHLVVKKVRDVTFTTALKYPSVYVIVMGMDPENEEDFSREIHTRLAEVPESERKYVVIVIIQSTDVEHTKALQTTREHTKFLETPDSNFYFETCVVMLPVLELLRSEELETNKPVAKYSARQELETAEPVAKDSAQELETNKRVAKEPARTELETKPGLKEACRRECSESVRSSIKAKVPSPQKRTSNPDKTSQHSDKHITLQISSEPDSDSDAKINVSTQGCERSDGSSGDYGEQVVGKAISYQLESKGIDIVQDIEKYLKHLKDRRDGLAGEILFTDLDKMLYELKGLYNVSETKTGRTKREEDVNGKLSEELVADLLKLDHVKGCGRIYGKLDVHVADDAETKQRENAKTAIESVIRRHKYTLPYSVRYIKSELYQMSELATCISIEF